MMIMTQIMAVIKEQIIVNIQQINNDSYYINQIIFTILYILLLFINIDYYLIKIVYIYIKITVSLKIKNIRLYKT